MGVHQIALPRHTFSPAMQVVYDAAAAAARTDASILIVGGEGSGKTFMAARIHELSGRAARPLASCNLSSLCVPLLEAQLFGRSADADPTDTAPLLGVLEEVARGSTIVLEEMGDAEARVREQMFETMKTRTITRGWSGRVVPIDVRFIGTLSASSWFSQNEAQRARVEEYSRQFDVTLRIPPLRERRSEIPELALMFARWQQPDFAADRIPPPIMELIIRYPWWRSNVRELARAMQEAVILSEGQEIGLEHLPRWILETHVNAPDRRRL